MIRHSRLLWLLTLLVIAAFTSAMGQSPASIEVKRFSNQEIGGECILKNARLSVEEGIVTKTFGIDVPQTGEYFLSAWAMVTNSEKGVYPLYAHVDGKEVSSGMLTFTRRGWQSAPLVDIASGSKRKISLAAGDHYISFRCEAPNTPAVDFVRLAKIEANAEIPEERFQIFENHIKQARMPSNYAILKRDSSTSRLMKTVGNPQGDYLHELEMDSSYTYYHMIYWAQAGSQVVFETMKTDPYASDPVMEFFNAEDVFGMGCSG